MGWDYIWQLLIIGFAINFPFLVWFALFYKAAPTEKELELAANRAAYLQRVRAEKENLVKQQALREQLLKDLGS